MEHPAQLAAAHEKATEAVQRLEEQAAAPAARLGVRIGSHCYLVEMAGIGEVVPITSITRVPWTRSWFRGVANVRGRLVGVYDVLQMAGGEPVGDGQNMQLLVLGDALKANAALLITRAFGLRYAKDLDPLPAVSAGVPWEGARFRDGDGATLTELNLETLVADERFSSIGL